MPRIGHDAQRAGKRRAAPFSGEILSIVGLVLLICYGHDSAWKVVSFSIYGATLILLYNFSTLYHWLPWEAGGSKQIFRKLDHLAIYLLIAGTYTPFAWLRSAAHGGGRSSG